MPIYDYQCSACGHRDDVLGSFSTPALQTCPSCHQETFAKRLTVAGFQLKGSGWYATDFKNSQTTKSPTAAIESTSSSASNAKIDSATSATSNTDNSTHTHSSSCGCA